MGKQFLHEPQRAWLSKNLSLKDDSGPGSPAAFTLVHSHRSGQRQGHTCATRQHRDKMILLLYMLERVHVWVFACTCTCVEAKRQSWVLFSGGRSTSLKQGLSVFWRSPTRLSWPVNPRVPPVCLQMLGLQACATTQTQVHTPGRQMLRHPRKVDI